MLLLPVTQMRSWIEQVSLNPRSFAGKTHDGVPPDLDRIKAMIADGWDLTVLTVKGERYVLVLGCRGQCGGKVGGNAGGGMGAE